MPFFHFQEFVEYALFLEEQHKVLQEKYNSLTDEYQRHKAKDSERPKAAKLDELNFKTSANVINIEMGKVSYA